MRRIVAVGVLAVLASACASTSASGSDATTPDGAPGIATSTSVAPATSASTTSSSTTSSTTSSTSTTTTVPPTTTLPLPSIVVPEVLPDVVEGAALGPLPDSPNARGAGGDRPDVYDNGCHVNYESVVPREGCFYGDTSSSTVIAVMGDSHAAAWLGAFDEAGKANGWKIVMVTKTGCPIADVTVYAAATEVKNDAYLQCDEWRPNALAYVNSLQPAMVVLPMLTRRTVVGMGYDGSTAAWQRGLGATIDAARTSGAKVLVVGDVPKTKGDSVPGCVGSHRNDLRVCANSRADAVKTARLLPVAATAVEHGATYYDVSNWFCTQEICPVVIGGIVVFRDEHHITDTFARYRAPNMAEAIRAAFATR